MKRFWRTAYWVVLGLPSAAFAIVALIEQTGVCGISPYDDFTCPAGFAYLLAPAMFGLVTFVPFIAIGGIWLVFGAVISVKQRRERK